VPTLVIARTDAESAKLITSDIDERDREFITGERTAEGFYRLKSGTGHAHCIKRGLAYAPIADLLWWETSHPNLDEARVFAEAIHRKFLFVTLAGFHSLNHGMFELARGYAERGMPAYCELQEAEFEAESRGYTATRHQREVGTGYFDLVNLTITGGASSTTAMSESTETAQFESPRIPQAAE
jgi:isocitrate lyase